MRVFLATERMVVREFTTDDVELLVALDNDPDVMRYLQPGVPVSRDEIVNETLPAFLAYYRRSPGLGFWAAIDERTERFLGWFHFRPAPGTSPLDVELGYRLHRFAWGRGLATEGSRALIDRGFAELGIDRVHAETMAVHTASRRVMEKAGLRYVHTFHADWPVPIPGDEHGDVEYAITRAEWEADRTADPPNR